MFFESRLEAGKKLADELAKLTWEKPLVLALPRGGIVIGEQVKTRLKCDLDVLLTGKIGAPFNEELALGALVEGEPKYLYRNEDLIRVLKTDEAYLTKQVELKGAEIDRRAKLYREDRTRLPLGGRSVILVDDGIATGSTIRAALEGILREKPARLMLAVPVAPIDVIQGLRKEKVAEILCLHDAKDFQAVGQYYRDFHQLKDEDVLRVLSA